MCFLEKLALLRFEKQKNALIINRLDKFYNVLCLCTNIISCEEKGCDSECQKGAKIAREELPPASCSLPTFPVEFLFL